MSLDSKDLDRINNQIKHSKGVLPMKFEKDDGDAKPPSIDDSLNGMGSNNDNPQNQGMETAAALKGFWKFIDMGAGMLASRFDAVDYIHLSDAELQNLSIQTSQVEAFQKLVVAENAPMWLTVANVIGTFGTKVKINEEWKNKRSAEKHAKKEKEAERPTITPEQQAILSKLRKPKMEPVYDGIPEDNSEPIEVYDKEETVIRDKLMEASELTEQDIGEMRLVKKKESIERRKQEILAAERARNNPVGILETQ